MMETKPCPYCAEPILVEARKCKHCGEYIDRKLRKQQEDKEITVRSKSSGLVTFLVILGIIALLVFMLGI